MIRTSIFFFNFFLCCYVYLSDPSMLDQCDCTYLLSIKPWSSRFELGNGFAPADPSSRGQELKLEPCNGKVKEGFANRNAVDHAYVDNK